MRRSPLVAALLAAAALLTAADGHAAKVVLTTCGQTVVGRAELTADLDCSAYAGHALVLDGTLALNGFTLTGNATDPGYSAVDCTAKCRVRIKGPGKIVGGQSAVSGNLVKLSKEIEIRDASAWGVTGAQVRASTVWVHGNGAGLPVGPDGGGGISGGKITVQRSTIESNASFGVNANVRAVLNFASVTDNGLVDLRSYDKPTVAKTTCLTSARGNLAENWGVCFNDN
jgi:hypothetical protein